MKKGPIRLLSLFLCVIMISLTLTPALCVRPGAVTSGGGTTAEKEAVVYLREGGTGDGSSASSPVRTLTEAMKTAASYGRTAKIQVIGEY